MKKETSKLIKNHRKNNEKALNHANSAERKYDLFGVLFILGAAWLSGFCIRELIRLIKWIIF